MPLPSPDNDYLVSRTDALTDALFNAVFNSVGARLRTIEAQRQDLQAVIDAGTAQAIAAVQSELAPYAAEAQSKAAQISAYLAAYEANANPLISAVLSAVLGSVESRGDTLAKLLALIDAANAVLADLAPSAMSDTTNAGNITSGTLALDRLPVIPTAHIDGLAASATSDTTNAGNITLGTLALDRLPAIPAAHIDGLAASATTDTTDASNIAGGTLPAGRLPNGSHVLVASYAASNSGTLGAANVFAVGGYAHYEVELANLVSSVDGNVVHLQLSPDGSGFLADANYEFAGFVVNALGSAAQAFSSKGAIDISRSGNYNSNGGGARGISGRIVIPKLAVAANEFLKMTYQIAGADSGAGGGLYSVVQTGQYRNTGVMTATGFQIFPSSGNFVSGVVNVYGYN